MDNEFLQQDKAINYNNNNNILAIPSNKAEEYGTNRRALNRLKARIRSGKKVNMNKTAKLMLKNNQ